jgi:hypothetical protein
MQHKTSLSIKYILILATLLYSCRKDKDAIISSPHAHQAYRSPVANAGADATVNIVSCYSNRAVELDGTKSFDPDIRDNLDDKIYFKWSQISGPVCTLSDRVLSKAKVSNLTAGQYAFELKVTDVKGLSSKDTVQVNVTGSSSPTEINLDVIINSSFVFSDNSYSCYEYGWFELCGYYDYTDIEGRFNLPPLGQVNFSAYEYADTATAGNYHDTHMSLSCNGCVPSQYLDGTCSINLKKLILLGGGIFSGTFKIEDGSAKHNCDQHVFDNTDPLTVSGNLDTTTHTISLTIKGKVYF